MNFHPIFPKPAVVFAALLPALAGWTAASAQSVLSNVVSCHLENFDSMGAGTSTPANWRVGVGARADLTTLTVNDGSIGPGADIAAFNFGLTFADPDRALGTIPASGSRSIELRLRNETGRDIHSFTVRYDGEQWRIGTLVAPSALVLRYSADGINFVDMGPSFNFTSPRQAQPPLLQNVAVNGNEPNNRVAGIGGDYTPAAPVPNGGVIYLRWCDADEVGDDPGLAIDNFSLAIIALSGPPVALGDDLDSAPDCFQASAARSFLRESTISLVSVVWSLATEFQTPPYGRQTGPASTAEYHTPYFRPQFRREPHDHGIAPLANSSLAAP